MIKMLEKKIETVIVHYDFSGIEYIIEERKRLKRMCKHVEENLIFIFK